MASKKELIVKKEDLNRVVEKKRVASGISYKVFEIPKGKSIGFRLKATTGTINIKETQERVYWIAQSTKEFKSATFLGWKSGAAEKELHEFLDMLDDEPGKWKDYGVKSNYIKSFEVVKGEFIYKPKSISYNGSEEGKGIWLEACNYYPSYGSQGAFLIPVASPYIKEFVVNKMVGQENLCVYDAKTKELQDEIHYCDFIEFTIKTHNILTEDFTGSITVECEGNILETIELNESHVLPQFEGTPAYNATYIKRKVYLDLKWVELLGHEEGSSKSYSFDVAFKLKDPSCFKHDVDASKIKKSIQKNVFYEEAWSINEEEVEAVPQIAEIFEPQVVTMEFEECRYTKLTVSHDIEKTNDAGKKTKEKREYTILEETDGCLSTNENIPTFAVIAGDKTNKPKIEIAISGLDRSECNGEHKNAKLIIFNDGKTTEMAMADKPKGVTTINLEVVSSLSEFNLYPLKYIWPSFISPNVYRTHVATCRYARPLLVNVYPDIKWELAFEFLVNVSNYKAANMPAGIIYTKHNEKSREAGYARWLMNKQGELPISLGVGLSAEWDNGSHKRSFTNEFQTKIKPFVKTISTAAEIVQNAINYAQGVAKQTAIPVGFDVRYPKFTIVGTWNLVPYKNRTAIVGDVGFGFKPLIGAELIIDIIGVAIAAASYGTTGNPAAARLINKFRKGLDKLGASVTFTATFYGELEIMCEALKIHSINGIDMSGKTTIGGKMGVTIILKMEVGIGKLKGRKKKAIINFRALAKADAFFGGEMVFDSDDKGLYMQPILKFSGVMLTVEIEGEVGWWKSNFKIEEKVLKEETKTLAKRYLN
ncbi:hypothetical protein [Tenacibaculum ovolyticum]|uniref:hypothetical protein n=1 Tax=Tenacibaculum ovolyticum TaxID=104270 RepID=UPI0004151370|nr:hypothetical protein [Tenacibaculum ovolyticum]